MAETHWFKGGGKASPNQNLACFINNFFFPFKNDIYILEQIVWETYIKKKRALGAILPKSSEVHDVFKQSITNNPVCCAKSIWDQFIYKSAWQNA